MAAGTPGGRGPQSGCHEKERRRNEKRDVREAVREREAAESERNRHYDELRHLFASTGLQGPPPGPLGEGLLEVRMGDPWHRGGQTIREERAGGEQNESVNKRAIIESRPANGAIDARGPATVPATRPATRPAKIPATRLGQRRGHQPPREIPRNGHSAGTEGAAGSRRGEGTNQPGGGTEVPERSVGGLQWPVVPANTGGEWPRTQHGVLPGTRQPAGQSGPQ